MLILVSNLYRCPVIAPQGGQLGRLGDIIIDIQNGRILGFRMIKSSAFSASRVIALSDIIALDRRVVIVNDPESVVPPTEVVRIKQALDTKIRLRGLRAYTENRSYLGKISDILIDTETGCVARYYLHHILRDRIIPSDKVIAITRRGIIFQDDFAAPSGAAEGAPA